MHQPGVFFWRVVLGGFWLGHTISRKTFFFRSEKELAKTARVLQASKIAFAFLYNFSPFSSRMYALYNGVYTFVRMCVAGGLSFVYILRPLYAILRHNLRTFRCAFLFLCSHASHVLREEGPPAAPVWLLLPLLPLLSSWVCAAYAIFIIIIIFSIPIAAQCL